MTPPRMQVGLAVPLLSPPGSSMPYGDGVTAGDDRSRAADGSAHGLDSARCGHGREPWRRWFGGTGSAVCVWSRPWSWPRSRLIRRDLANFVCRKLGVGSEDGSCKAFVAFSPPRLRKRLCSQPGRPDAECAPSAPSARRAHALHRRHCVTPEPLFRPASQYGSHSGRMAAEIGGDVTWTHSSDGEKKDRKAFIDRNRPR